MGTEAIADVTVPALGHQLEKVGAKAASCTEEGNIEHYACSVCGGTFRDPEGTEEVADVTVPALGHQMVKTLAKAASCTGEGNIRYYTCSVCGGTFRDPVGTEAIADVTVPATGHVCGEPAWSWTGFTAAATFTCSVCGDIQTPAVTVTDRVTKQPTAAETGEKVYTASVVFGGMTYTDTRTETLPTLGMTVVSQPVDGSAAYLKTAKATFTVSGDGVAYQWYGRDPGQSAFWKSGIKTETYSVVMVPEKTGRQVYCVATDLSGNSVASDVVTLTMTAPEGYALTVASQPADRAVGCGKYAVTTFSVNGDGLAYQWYGRDPGQSAFWKSGRKTDTYTVSMAPEKSGREVCCVVTDAYGNSITSRTATLTMCAPEGYALTVKSQPVDCSVAVKKAASATFSVAGDGLTYEWYGRDPGQTAFWKSGANTTNRYTVVMTSEKSGRQVYCVATDAYGNTVTSDIVTLSLTR